MPRVGKLDHSFRVIAWEVLFYGSVNGCSVHPRSRGCRRHNCTAIILAHQHPSGDPEPSVADRQLTRRLREGLAYFDIKCWITS
ncbi:MAG: JAB domain-containing protein [Candidatus Competibacteraceae bacterium]